MEKGTMGGLIRRLRTEKGMTQAQLAERMNISDKTVSKWERDMGCPDISMLPVLSEIFGVDLSGLLAGRLDANRSDGGNMKNTRFYVCPECGDLIISTREAAVACCGRRLSAIEPKKAEEGERLHLEPVEDEIFVTAPGHPMERGHYIMFVALLTGDGLTLRRHYPQWDLSQRLPARSHGRLLWYDTRDGLFYMNI